jgi:Ca2+/Na+ antiporter
MMDLYDYNSGFMNITLYILIHALLLTILLWMIIYRYIPYDEQGYLNYFKNKWDNGNEGNGVDKIIKGEDLENVKNDNNIRIVVIVVFVILFISIIIIIIFFNNQINDHKYKVTAIVILLIIWGIFIHTYLYDLS